MNIEKFSNREQVLIFMVVTTLVAGSYGLFRYAPQLKALAELQTTVTKNIQRVKNPNIPDDPTEDVEDLKDKVEDFDTELISLRATLADAEKNLAPVDSKQDVLLKISEIARVAGVRVIENVPNIVQRKDGVAAAPANTKRLTARQARKQAREVRKQAVKVGNNAITSGSSTIPKEGELIYRLVNELEAPRPFQKISVEGSFTDLQKFIQSLRTLPWQATIVKIDIDVAIQTPPQGVPQPITARMIVAI